MGNWSSFFTVQAEAAATLSGLIFIGISINLSKILEHKKLPNRGLVALILLLNSLVISSLCLINQYNYIGYEVLAFAGASWVLICWIDIGIWKHTHESFRGKLLALTALNQVVLLSFLIGTGCILCFFPIPNFDAAFSWFAVGSLTSIVKAIIDAWVLLVEINR
jgi:hypothetical protein